MPKNRLLTSVTLALNTGGALVYPRAVRQVDIGGTITEQGINPAATLQRFRLRSVLAICAALPILSYSVVPFRTQTVEPRPFVLRSGVRTSLRYTAERLPPHR